MELETTFGSSHGDRLAEEDMLGSFQPFASEGMDHDVYSFSEGGMSADTWFDCDINANAEDFATYCTPPSTPSTSEIDILSSGRASVPSRNPCDSDSGSYRSRRSHTSSPSFGRPAHRKLSTPSIASEQIYSPLHLCHLCNRSFTLSKDLKRHMRSIHDQERFQCPVPGCGLAFPRKDKLLQHRRTHNGVHSGVQDDSTSSRLSNASNGGFVGGHIGPIHVPPPPDHSDSSRNWDFPDEELSPAPLSHPSYSNEDKNKRFVCPHCQQGFNLHHDRLRHLRTLHSRQENGIVYRCAAPGCAKGDKMWTRLDNFKKHLATQHAAESVPELVQKSKTLGSSGAFTITTPEMFSQ